MKQIAEIKSIEKEKPKALNINKPAYTIFVITGIIFILLKDWSTASIMISLALVFDPFDINMPWGKRPLWQKVWLIVHLAISVFLLAYTFMIK